MGLRRFLTSGRVKYETSREMVLGIGEGLGIHM